VTHNLQQAQRVADRTAFFYVDTSAGGRTGYLIEYRATEELFDDPREDRTKAYLRGEFS
jgi:phosphate transport system ATP-binding protein